VGWSVGAKAGVKGFDEVVDAMRTVKESEEFAALVMVARSHAAAAIQEVGKLMSGETALPESTDLLERVQRLTGMAR